MDGAAFCPFCGEKVSRGEPAAEGPIYQVDVKGLLRSGKLIVYRDRAEFVTSSVQKAIFNYSGLVSIKKGWDSIDFVTEDGRTESCPAGRKTVHEAFLYIEQAAKPYLDQRKDRLMSQGVRYSFPSSQGFLNDGVLELSADQAEFRAKSGRSDVVSFRDVKSVSSLAGTLDFLLFGGRTKSFAVSKELRDEVLAFVTESIAPYLAQRREALLARGIYFSFLGAEGGTLDILADRAEYKAPSGQAETVSFQDVRTAGVYSGMLDLALTDGTSRSFPVDADAEGEVLAFVRKAIEPYVLARTVGFDASFGIDERVEINEERGVFHIIRQGGREISEEWPLDALTRCQWVEDKELNALGSMVSGGIALFKTAAKAAGNQAAGEAEERISCAGVVLTVRTEQGEEPKTVWFGIFTAGMSRNNRKYDRYLAEWGGIADFLKLRCPECELIEPVLPEAEVQLLEPAAETADAAPALPQAAGGPAAGGAEPVRAPDAAQQQDDLGIAKYLDGVSRFIGNCTTPMAIAFQGNRGSGENSVLRILFNRLKGRYGDDLLWLSVRQFSQGESGEALSIQLGKKLVGLFSGETGPEGKGQAENIIVNLAGLVTGVIVSDSSIGKEMAGGLFGKDAANTSEQLVQLFSRQVEARRQSGSGKVVLFIDGLERLTPARGVELLEAMRDFFECRGCVFVIAADHNAILAGARERHGPGENGGEDFYDAMFKMSFRVPASSYNVRSYVRSKLEHIDVSIEDEEELDLYVALIQSSVGKDPEGIDRLFGSFHLLKNMADEETYKSRYKRLALFALLCMQTSFRSAYDYAIRMRDNVTPESLAGLCGQPTQALGMDQAGGEAAAFQEFSQVFARIINLDEEAEISQEECQAFAEVLEISSITSK